jgi:hypothetical protein
MLFNDVLCCKTECISKEHWWNDADGGWGGGTEVLAETLIKVPLSVL